MSKRGLGLVLALTVAVAVGAAAVLQDFRFDRSLAQEHVSAEQVSRRLETAQLSIANLRGAQAGYLAVGQGPDFWMKRAGDLAANVEKNLSDAQAAASSVDARAHCDAAMSILGGINSLDQKARDDIASGERLLASDVIFMDLTESGQRLNNEIAAAREIERTSSDARIAALRRWRLQLDAAAIGLLTAIVLGVGLRRPRQAPAAEPVVEVPVEILAPPPVLVAAPAPVAAPVEAPVEAPRVNLSDAAQVCVDLARVLDGNDVPSLLERAAHVLEAKGLVLWVADPAGAMLRPSLTHGYSDKIVRRLGPLQVDADNVTSLAFRSMRPQTLSSRSNGVTDAIAVPLIASTGCIGVLAAEVSQSIDSDDRLAVARMFAAQLATLVTTDAAAPKTAQA
jgi:uncharacterized protein YdcH (DUF465 family)